ncbi:PRC-barrel domain containing protein [Halorussus sp. AFM4]|uniref:PRC-barrel domain containing protein n=1 Tax=Halorussus sp. AFM4 TaxID=3421651 RepID=UPI003EBAA83D
MARFSSADEGKTVTLDGESVGTITSVEGDTARVDPESDVTDRIRSKLEWDDPERDTHTISDSRVADITDEEVRLTT